MQTITNALLCIDIFFGEFFRYLVAEELTPHDLIFIIPEQLLS